jgi:hypothetical protein
LSTIARVNPTDIASWPPAFRSDEAGSPLSQINLGDGHYVLARETVDRRELVS